MSKDFLNLQTATLKAIEASPLKDSELGLLWAERYDVTAKTATQRIYQWRSYGLPLSIMSLVQLLDLLGYDVKVERRKKQ
jgi:hypothetical protein